MVQTQNMVLLLQKSMLQIRPPKSIEFWIDHFTNMTVAVGVCLLRIYEWFRNVWCVRDDDVVVEPPKPCACSVCVALSALNSQCCLERK